MPQPGAGSAVASAGLCVLHLFRLHAQRSNSFFVPVCVFFFSNLVHTSFFHFHHFDSDPLSEDEKRTKKRVG